MTEITLSQLNDICLNVVAAYDPGDPLMNAFLYLMYNTGLRSNEVMQLNRYTNGPPEYYTALLEKGNGTRDIELIYALPVLQNLVLNGALFNPYTYSALQYSIGKASPVVTFGSNTNRSLGHMFRYRFIKQLGDDGLSIPEIMEITKQSSTTTVEIYLNDLIYTHP